MRHFAQLLGHSSTKYSVNRDDPVQNIQAAGAFKNKKCAVSRDIPVQNIQFSGDIPAQNI
jgi:hypothetical protein